jgi:hypothetical protein
MAMSWRVERDLNLIVDWQRLRTRMKAGKALDVLAKKYSRSTHTIKDIVYKMGIYSEKKKGGGRK